MKRVPISTPYILVVQIYYPKIPEIKKVPQTNIKPSSIALILPINKMERLDFLCYCVESVIKS